MTYVDAHCDTITTIMKTGEALKKNSGHIDLERLKKLIVLFSSLQHSFLLSRQKWGL